MIWHNACDAVGGGFADSIRRSLGGSFGEDAEGASGAWSDGKGFGDDFRRAAFTQLGDEQQPSSALMAVEV
jgi:hypothetical protein